MLSDVMVVTSLTGAAVAAGAPVGDGVDTGAVADCIGAATGPVDGATLFWTEPELVFAVGSPCDPLKLALAGAWAVLAMGGEVCTDGTLGVGKPGCAVGLCCAGPCCCVFGLGVGGISLICEEAYELRAITPSRGRIGQRTNR